MIRLACVACLLLYPVVATAQTLAVRGADGTVLGFYTGPGATTGGSAGYFRIVSSTGYATAYNVRLGTVTGSDVLAPADGGTFENRIKFTSTDCSGQGYVEVTNLGFDNFVLGRHAAPGFVFNAGLTIYELWYVARGAVAFPAGPLASQIQRSRYNGVCSATSPPPPETVLYPATPNDPSVTGFPNSPAVPPLTIEPVPVSAVFSIFRDSFESPQASMALDQHASSWLASSRVS